MLQRGQKVEPSLLANFPDGHWMHKLELPPAKVEKVPAGQKLQATEDALVEKVPAGHNVHLEAPTEENDPGKQSRHTELLVAPSILELVPAQHLLHEEAAVTLLYDPGAHGVHELAPTLEKVPTGQLKQVEISVAPSSLENLPAMHPTHEDTP